MTIFIFLILGVIQGLTEFLPISSSGHLVVLYEIFGIENDTVFLSILLHISTLLSVLIYYRKEILILITHPFCPTNRKIILTTIVTCILVLILKPIIDIFFTAKFLFIPFLITAMILFISDFLSEKHSLLSRTNLNKTNTTTFERTEDITNLDISYKQAIIIGLTQGIATIPGISRSGSTIAVARMLNVKDSASYSFLISIPIIIASLVLELVSGGLSIRINILPMILSMIVCFVVGLISIKVMIRFVRNNKLSYFGYYLIILAGIIIFAF